MEKRKLFAFFTLPIEIKKQCCVWWLMLPGGIDTSNCIFHSLQYGWPLCNNINSENHKKQPNFAELFKIDCDLKAVTKFPSYCDTIYTSSLFTLNIILSRVLDHGCLNSFLLLCGMFFSGSMKMNFSDFPVAFGKVTP